MHSVGWLFSGRRGAIADLLDDVLDRRRSRAAPSSWSIAAAAGTGGGLMYFFDPSQGRRRRARARDKAVHARHSIGAAFDATSNDFAHRWHGIWAEVTSYFSPEAPSDDVIAARIRSRLGYVCSHPHAIHITVERGRVWLTGKILQHEAGKVLRTAARVRGVRDIKSDLQLFDGRAGVPDLQGGTERRGRRFELLQDNWSPAARLVAGGTGLGLVSYALMRRSAGAALAGVAGSALCARSISNMPLRSVFGLPGGETHGIEVVKTVNVDAAVEEVYRFFEEPTNVPKFMEHVNAVTRLEDGRLRWEFRGPLDVPVVAHTETIRAVPNEILEWRATGDSALRLDGMIHFERQGERSTRMHLQMSYAPPAGAIGHTVARIMGADPKKQLDRDMVRFKSLVEHGKATVHGRSVMRDDVERPVSSP